MDVAYAQQRVQRIKALTERHRGWIALLEDPLEYAAVAASNAPDAALYRAAAQQFAQSIAFCACYADVLHLLNGCGAAHATKDKTHCCG
jgi:hypothetical protein